MPPGISYPIGPSPALRGAPLAAERSSFQRLRFCPTSSISFPNVMCLSPWVPTLSYRCLTLRRLKSHLNK